MTTPPRDIPIDGVLFIGFGGPTRREEIMPFLRNVVRGRGVPEERLAAVAHHYEAIGGRSPYNELTEAQARGVERWLREHETPLPVHVGMRNWSPYLAEALGTARDEGHRHLAGVILAPHRSEVSWDRYRAAVKEACDSLGGGAPRVSYVSAWHEDAGFIEACVQRLEESTRHARGSWPAGRALVFTAHSIPRAMAGRSSYVDEIQASCRGVAARLGVSDWEIAWQSRSGDPRTPWLEPDISDVLRRRAADGARDVVVQAIGFLCDHVEVLYDLDVEAARAAAEAGITMRRAACVNDHPEFVATLGRAVLSLAARFG